MKKVLVLLCVVLNLSLADDKIVFNECVSDIYYGNGIMTTELEALNSLNNTLIPAIKEDIYNGNQELMKQKHNFKLAYNYSAKEKFGDTPSLVPQL